jgi:hypothetical protein
LLAEYEKPLGHHLPAQPFIRRIEQSLLVQNNPRVHQRNHPTMIQTTDKMILP